MTRSLLLCPVSRYPATFQLFYGIPCSTKDMHYTLLFSLPILSTTL